MRRILLPLVLLFSATFAAIWFYAQTTLSGALDDLASASDPAPVSVGGHAVGGFPARLSADLQDVVVRSETGAPVWQGATLTAGVDTYNPTRLSVAFPPVQTITIAQIPLTLSTVDMALDARASLGLFLPLEFATVTARDLMLDAPDIQPLRADTLDLALTHAGGESYDVAGVLSDITLPDDLRAAIDPDSTLPAQMAGVTLDATVTLTNTLNRVSAKALPQVTQLDLRSIETTWGPLGLSATGQVDVDPQGFPTGTITLTLRDYEALLDRLIGAGIIPSNQAFLVQMLARSASDGGADLMLPITMTQGEARLGGSIPLGTWQLYRQ